MKIQTNNRVYIGQSIKFAKGIRATFDGKGVAKVNDFEGEFLLGHYKGILFPEGQPPKETPSKPLTLKEGATVEDLKNRLASANQIAEGLKRELGQAKEAENVWRRKSQELLEANDQLKKGQFSMEEYNKLKDEFNELLTGYNELRVQYDQLKEEKRKLEEKEIETQDKKTDLTEDEKKKQEEEKKIETDLILKNKLKLKKKDELVAMARELTLPEDEWKSYNKEDLIDYLIGKSNT